MAETAFAPLQEPIAPQGYPRAISAPTRKYDTAETYKPPTQPLNPAFVPDEFIALNKQLEEEGSSTSTLSHILAWGAAIKGNPQALLAIEDAKRRTALGKALIPHVQKFNDLANTGKFEEANKYIDTIAGSFGARASELVPYFQQMQAKVSKRQEGYEQLRSLLQKAEIEGQDNPNNVNHKTYLAMKKAVESKSYWDTTALLASVRASQPHIQEINGRLTLTNPMSNEVQTIMLPAVTKRSEVDNFIGQTVASKNNLNINDISDIMNNLPVKDLKGNVIMPGSTEAMTVKAQYSSMLPMMARLEMVSRNFPLDPAMALQAAKEVGPENVAFRFFSGGDIDRMLKGQMERIKEQQVATNIATQESDPFKLAQSGSVVLGIDPNNPSTLLKPQPNITLAEVRASKGKLREYPKEVYDVQVIPAYSGIQSLDVIPQILKINPLETRGDTLAKGIDQRLSRLLGYPVTRNVEVRQQAKTILNKAIEQAENIILKLPAGSGHDNQDIDDLKRYKSGDFTSTKDMLKAVDFVRERLNTILDRAVGVTIPKPSSEAKTPVQAIAPLVPTQQGGIITPQTKQSPTTGQVTRNPYTPSGAINVPPDIDTDIQRRIADSIAKGKRGGAVRVEVPNVPSSGTTVQPVSPTVPTAPTVSPPPISAEDRIKAAVEKKRLEKGR